MIFFFAAPQSPFIVFFLHPLTFPFQRDFSLTALEEVQISSLRLKPNFSHYCTVHHPRPCSVLASRVLFIFADSCPPFYFRVIVFPPLSLSLFRAFDAYLSQPPLSS